MDVRIETGNRAAAYWGLGRIPELESLPAPDVFWSRIEGRPALILTAHRQQAVVGVKIGYERYQDGSFYSWLGGVVPEARRQGVASALLREQESWAWQAGYRCIRVKTRPVFPGMIALLHRHGYRESRREERESWEETRIWFIKEREDVV
ncbi:MAG: GNAT family N-acetyltransferase [Candidatus Neomarinimicrobiota bacterium]|nr:MAG: GNAT family N-acetyltransferase [Candidatus Neomarinimicrobiota bacterium]